MAQKGHDLNTVLNRAQKSVLDFLFPRKCPFCGAPVGKALLCDACENSLPYHEGVREGAGFGRCAAPLRYEGAVGRRYCATNSAPGWIICPASAD